MVSSKRARGSLIRIRAAANRWLSDNLGEEQRYLAPGDPKYDDMGRLWLVDILAKPLGGQRVGALKIDESMTVADDTGAAEMAERIREMRRISQGQEPSIRAEGKFGLSYGDGVAASGMLDDLSVDLLLTDPPYGISSPYSCERQIPRRLRRSGTDFIMPKGDFGKWDYGFSPEKWTDVILPKVRGWCVIFCAQEQIGQYSEILKRHKFNSVGTLVWHKTNPVPFNHKSKPLNAWEAAVVGKRPGTRFNGASVHNVFTYKSPSPQHRIHPTQKPLALIERLIDLFSGRGDTVLDPFAGSATTSLGSLRMSRRCIAFENNRDYYNAAVVRLEGSLGARSSDPAARLGESLDDYSSDPAPGAKELHA